MFVSEELIKSTLVFRRVPMYFKSLANEEQSFYLPSMLRILFIYLFKCTSPAMEAIVENQTIPVGRMIIFLVLLLK